MQFLLASWTTPPPRPCGRCGNCAPVAEEPLDPAEVARAIEFVRGQPLLVDPRRQWPSGLDEVRGRIPAELQVEEGRALCLWTDGGWGTRVRAGRKAGAYADELVGAAARLVDHWAPAPAPTWVTAVPSDDRPEVATFAEALADAVGLPFVAAVTTAPRKRRRPPARTAPNRSSTCSGPSRSTVAPPGPVLLVDDTASSRWTMTVVGAACASRGPTPCSPWSWPSAEQPGTGEGLRRGPGAPR